MGRGLWGRRTRAYWAVQIVGLKLLRLSRLKELNGPAIQNALVFVGTIYPNPTIQGNFGSIK